jgi:hypothetical protein
MRKFLITSAVALSTLGLVACSDNVDEGTTGSVTNDPAIQQPMNETPADPMVEPAPAPVN